jgi:hypothetical protein
MSGIGIPLWQAPTLGGRRAQLDQRDGHILPGHLLARALPGGAQQMRQHHAGIVDERVQTPQLGDRTRNCAGRLLLVSDVTLQHQRGAASATAAP